MCSAADVNLELDDRTNLVFEILAVSCRKSRPLSHTVYALDSGIVTPRAGRGFPIAPRFALLATLAARTIGVGHVVGSERFRVSAERRHFVSARSALSEEAYPDIVSCPFRQQNAKLKQLTYNHQADLPQKFPIPNPLVYITPDYCFSLMLRLCNDHVDHKISRRSRGRES